MINGTADCILDEETGNVTDCKCLLLPKNFNAKAHFAFAQAVFSKSMHTSRDCTEWDKFQLLTIFLQ